MRKGSNLKATTSAVNVIVMLLLSRNFERIIFLFNNLMRISIACAKEDTQRTAMSKEEVEMAHWRRVQTAAPTQLECSGVQV